LHENRPQKREDKEVSEHVRNDNLWHIVAVEAKHFVFQLKNKRCNLRQILRAVNDLTNQWSFFLRLRDIS
jgi:hypothetical protein